MVNSKKFMKAFSHIGYGAKGFVYIVLGILSIQTVVGISEGVKGARGVLQEIGSQPFGNILLIILACGLTCYVVWRVLHAVLDPDKEGSDFYGLIYRAGFLLSAIMHAGLVYLAVKLIIGSTSGESGQLSRDATATVMSLPLGQILVGLVGLGIVGSGMYEVYFAFTEKYKNLFNLDQMSDTEKLIVAIFAKAGLSLRGIVFSVIGVLFALAAITYNPDKVGGLAKALDEISKQPFGQWLLGFFALGFIAYGIYIIMLIRFRKL